MLKVIWIFKNYFSRRKGREVRGTQFVSQHLFSTIRLLLSSVFSPVFGVLYITISQRWKFPRIPITQCAEGLDLERILWSTAGKSQLYWKVWQLTGSAWKSSLAFTPKVQMFIKLSPSLLACPRYRWLPNRRGGVSGFGVPPASMRRAAEEQRGGGRHNWGQGFRLGDQWRTPALGKEQLSAFNWMYDRPFLLQSMLKNWALCSTVGFNWLERIFLLQEKIKSSRREKCRSCSRLASSVQSDSAIKKRLLYTVLYVCRSGHPLCRLVLWCDGTR